MGKICSILLALALVLSFTVVATPVSADEWPELAVNITAPLNGADIIGGTEFTVTANVTNNGTEYAKDVKAKIEISGNATLKAGHVATKTVATQLGVGWSAVVSWTLVCTGGGAVNITVTPEGTDPGTLNLIGTTGAGFLYSDTVSVIQEQVLKVIIVEPADNASFNVTQGFEVKANVKNISSLNATEVKLTISIDRYAELEAGQVATLNVPPLASNTTSANYTWILKCTGDGFSRITVRPSGEFYDEEADDNIPIPDDALIPATVTVEQGDFVKASIELDEGWNLISLPLIPLDWHIEVVLAGIMEDVISVWYWAGDWYMYDPSDAPDDLHFMEDGKAYWIDMDAAQPLDIAGTEMPKGGGMPHDYDVVVGWNMVGFKSTADNVTVEVYLAGTKYIRIYWFKNGTWHSIPGTSYNTTTMVPGLGYWVAFTEPGTIYP